MPVLNSRRQIVAGVGSGPISIDNHIIAVGGASGWLDDDRVIFNGPNATGAWVLRQYDQRTGHFLDLNPAGANFIAAGGGRYAAQAESLYANFPFAAGSRIGLTISDGRGPASTDGAIALCPTPQCDSFDVYRPGQPVESHAGVAYNLQLVEPGVAIWDGGSVGITLTLPVPLVRRRLVRLMDGDWIVGYQNGVGLVALLNGATVGYYLTTGLAFQHDARAINGDLVVGWSTTQGEGPGSNVVVTVDRSQPRVPIVAPTPPVVYPAYHFDHPVIVAPFFAAGSGLPDVFTFGAYYTEVPPAVPPPHQRVLLLHDGEADWAVPPGLRPFDCVLRELYRVPAETLDQSIARWHRQVRQTLAEWAGDVGVVPMFYDQLRWTVQQILDGLTALSGIVNLSPRVKLIDPFAYQLANGIIKYPELQRSLDDLDAAHHRAGTATLTPIPPDPIPPKPEPPPMNPNVPIGDDQIIELAGIYDAANPVSKGKDLAAYLRDAAYYGFGYFLYRAYGDPHETALEKYRAACVPDAYYSQPPPQMPGDNEVIFFSERWTNRYSIIGRLQQQSRVDNARDETYWLIVYDRQRVQGTDQETAMRNTENGMAQEAGMPLPYPPPPIGPIPAPKVYPHCYTCPASDSYDKTPWWSDADLANPDFLRASYWSVVVPGLPFVPGNVPWSGGSSEHPERLITGLDYKYDRSLWPSMTQQTLRRGFTSWLRWWGNARVDGGNSIDQFVQDCLLLKQHGIPQVKVALWCKDADPHDMSADQLKSYFSPILDTLLSNNAVQEIWPGMEWNFGNVPGQPTYDFFRWLGEQCHAHGVKMGAHFSSHVPAWQTNGHDWREFWDTIGDAIDYLNYQAELVPFNVPPGANEWDIGEFQARMVDIMNFFGDRGNRWKIRAAEFSALLSFSGDHPNEDEHNSLGYLAACTRCKHSDTHVWGSGDGIPWSGQ